MKRVLVRMGLLLAGLSVFEVSAATGFPLVEGGTAATVVYATNDAAVVKIASQLFAEDIERVSGILPSVETSVAGISGPLVLIGTIGHSPELDELISQGRVDVSSISGGWERYHIEMVEQPFSNIPRALVIAGSDRRGTAYGAFSISESIGVSPWYWWADAETRTSEEIIVDASPFSSEPPSVKYRGIFINDEDWGLQEWSEKNFEAGADGVQDIGPRTYARVFELLLRLKANYCWPAMHDCTDAFNSYEDNKVVADQYAIVMGSSHAEPMLRNNVFEWYNDIDPVTGQPYSNGSWDYEDNKAGIYRYWEQRAIANGGYENVYTVGKRGIHDSGMVEGSSTAEKAGWLNTIFADQRQILADHVNPDVTQVGQIFVPYKEVLDIYDSGLVNVPDDVMMGWPDDNHGYIRRLSDAAEQSRGGGGGVYYHISYWGSPRDYLWICSTPPALVWEELTKAYAYNCGRLWVINVGDIKPAEIVLEFAMRLAWDVDRYDGDAQTEWLTEWAVREFGADRADEIASILNEYYRLGYERKPEHMDWVDSDDLTPSGPYSMFSNVHHGDEAGRRLSEYSSIVSRANAVYAALPADRQSLFYEAVLYPLRGADGMNRKFIEAAKAHVASLQGRNTVTARKAASQDGYNDIQSETAIYNALEGGKWNHMMQSDPHNAGSTVARYGMPTLPSDPVLSSGRLGVAVEGRLEPAFIDSVGITYQQVPGYIGLNAATDYTSLTGPMAVETIDGKQAIYLASISGGYASTPGTGGQAVYTFDVPESGDYTLSCEINCPTVNDDSWYIKMDNGSTLTWNNLSNGGVWGWTSAGSYSLSAGSHTLTVYAREDGAAMANIKLQDTTTSVLVEDRRMPGFELPEFNARTRRSYFIDLFNTGTGSVSWQIVPSNTWLQVSTTSGLLSSEERVWVSIDWASAPRAESVSTGLTVESAGQSLFIPVTLWNPSNALPVTVDFVEDNGVVAIEAENYSSLLPASDSTWNTLSGLGQGGGVMMVSPVTAESREGITEIMNSSPALVYDTYIRSSGTVSVMARFIPTLAINGDRRLRYAVSFDDEVPQIVDMTRTSGSGSVWSRSVLRAHIDYTTSHTLPSPGEHRLKIWMVDPGVVMDRIEIRTGDVPYTYRGSPESAVESFGSYRIDEDDTLIMSSGESVHFDSVTNNGTMTLLGSASPEIGGAFVNYGTLDIMTWQGLLPDGFINYGTVLDAGDIFISDVLFTGSVMNIDLHGYSGHGYQLQERDGGSLLSGSWMNIGAPVYGVNAPITFPVEVLSATQGFYRVQVSP
ncbi:MAG: glycosyl hydrolase 115 family protein [Pontiellaceae bacterium]|nr:glycosyl hydrolase 115 family protein [Pontiellaceae bacterium]MBN2783234.1 glycosyl hydrolase 115 family protein [Pontiellaceae bacterium]